jgi:transcriptional regulator with XRE-family HTH domain
LKNAKQLSRRRSRQPFGEMTVGERLQWLLVVRRTTQVELAARVGVTQSAIANIIGKRASVPSARTLLGLAKALECAPEFLLFGDGYPSVPHKPNDQQEADLLATYRGLRPSEQGTLLVFARILKSGSTVGGRRNVDEQRANARDA